VIPMGLAWSGRLGRGRIRVARSPGIELPTFARGHAAVRNWRVALLSGPAVVMDGLVGAAATGALAGPGSGVQQRGYHQAQEWPSQVSRGLLAARPDLVLAASVWPARKPGSNACIGPAWLWMGVGGSSILAGQKKKRPPPGWELCRSNGLPASIREPHAAPDVCPWPAFAWAGCSAVLSPLRLSSGDAWSLPLNRDFKRSRRALYRRRPTAGRKGGNDRRMSTSGRKAWLRLRSWGSVNTAMPVEYCHFLGMLRTRSNRTLHVWAASRARLPGSEFLCKTNVRQWRGPSPW